MCGLLYQKIFTDEKPYYIGIGRLAEFPEHRHADFELNFCVKGEFDIIINKKTYHVKEGSTTFIPPMCSHAIPAEDCERSVITLIVGVSLLKKYFKDFSVLSGEPRVLELDTPDGERARELFYESAEVKRQGEPYDELLLCGNVYKIMAYIFKVLSGNKTESAKSSDYREVENVERAIELIYYNYKEGLPIEYVAETVGYSKSNFCKIFKKVVGESFHQALNRRRVECAAGLLRVTSLSVAEISAEVGFGEPKAFCRVFKAIFGITPGQYRRAK
jgi:AraC-like DNA-binding protein